MVIHPDKIVNPSGNNLQWENIKHPIILLSQNMSGVKDHQMSLHSL